MARIRQGCTAGKSQLDHLFVSLSGADDASTRPHGYPQRVAGLDPFARLKDVRLSLVDEAANLRQGLCAPATQRAEPLVYEVSGCRRARALRWRIETYFKILKTGCRPENLRLRTAARLANAIAVHCVLAWRIYWMTMINRDVPEAAASLVFTCQWA